MLTIVEYKVKRAALIDKAQAIRTSAKALDREETDEELEKITSLLAEADGVKAEIETKEQKIKALGQLDAALADLSKPDKPQTLLSGDLDPHAGLTSVRPRVEDDPNCGYKTPRAFLVDVMAASSNPAAGMSENLKFLAAIGSDEQNTFSDPHGGFLVPEGFSPNLLSVGAEGDPTVGRVMNVPMNTPTVKIPARVDKVHTSSVSGGLTVTRTEQAGAATASRMTFEKIGLSVNTLMGLSYITEEAITDSAISFAAIIAQGFNDEFSSEIFNEKLNGTGSGEYLGILNSDALVTVDEEGSQANDSVVIENILKMRSRCWGYSNAIWMANHDVYPQLALIGRETDLGGSLYTTSMREDRPDLLMGRPIFYTEYLSTIGDANDIVLANWSQYLEGTLERQQSAESIHVRFVNHERAFKFWTRNDGRPWWTAALTPKNSTNTLSPFVALGERAT